MDFGVVFSPLPGPRSGRRARLATGCVPQKPSAPRSHVPASALSSLPIVINDEMGLTHVTCQFHNLPEALSARLEYLEGFGTEVIQKLAG